MYLLQRKLKSTCCCKMLSFSVLSEFKSVLDKIINAIKEVVVKRRIVFIKFTVLFVNSWKRHNTPKIIINNICINALVASVPYVTTFVVRRSIINTVLAK